MQPSQRDALSLTGVEELYRAYLLDEGGLRRSTSYLYLNLYDPSEDFAVWFPGCGPAVSLAPRRLPPRLRRHAHQPLHPSGRGRPDSNSQFRTVGQTAASVGIMLLSIVILWHVVIPALTPAFVQGFGTRSDGPLRLIGMGVTGLLIWAQQRWAYRLVQQRAVHWFVGAALVVSIVMIVYGLAHAFA